MEDTFPDIFAQTNDRWGPAHIIRMDRIEPNFEARLAMILIEKWGMVAATDAGEDSSGRAKLRLMGPVEVVERACYTAKLAYDQLDKLGWLKEVPSYDQLVADAEAKRKSEKESN